MINNQNVGRRGFTLVEIMIVVAIIALLAAIAVPNFLRARKRSQATLILDDLRMFDSAVSQYAIDNNKATGDTVNFTDYRVYLKTGSPLYNTGRDLFGNVFPWYNPGGASFATAVVDAIPTVHPNTFSKLSDVAPSDFWSPYYN